MYSFFISISCTSEIVVQVHRTDFHPALACVSMPLWCQPTLLFCCLSGQPCLPILILLLVGQWQGTPPCPHLLPQACLPVPNQKECKCSSRQQTSPNFCCSSATAAYTIWLPTASDLHCPGSLVRACLSRLVPYLEHQRHQPSCPAAPEIVIAE